MADTLEWRQVDNSSTGIGLSNLDSRVPASRGSNRRQSNSQWRVRAQPTAPRSSDGTINSSTPVSDQQELAPTAAANTASDTAGRQREGCLRRGARSARSSVHSNDGGQEHAAAEGPSTSGATLQLIRPSQEPAQRRVGKASSRGQQSTGSVRTGASSQLEGRVSRGGSSKAKRQYAVQEGVNAGEGYRRHKDVPQLVQELEERLARGIVECMICYESVGRRAAIWSCNSCFALFHLSCVRAWASAPTSAAPGPDLASATPITSRTDSAWRCPGCQTPQNVTPTALKYSCFCGKRADPPVDHYLTPHSCGEPCGQSLSCQVHTCVMPCHPGPHPPCTANAPPQKCFCGALERQLRCGDPDRTLGWSCAAPCDQLLSCGRHHCARQCHDGACMACEELVVGRCHCRRQEQALPCWQVDEFDDLGPSGGLFSCDEVCGRMLSCGNHRCQMRCHAGSCGDCQLAPAKVTTCPCGKHSLQELMPEGQERKSCLDRVPTCKGFCGKQMPCGHKCRGFCHMGSCPRCIVTVEQKCRCGKERRKVQCHQATEAFLCEGVCNKKKSCGRHRCNERCCPGGLPTVLDVLDADPHVCLLTCGKKLQCGIHTCQELCHSRHCRPCQNSSFEELRCACGRTSIPPPVPCGTLPPNCPLPCHRAQPCGHEPTHLCHHAEPCPPCSILVTRQCVGGHVTLRNLPCGSKEPRCNALCGKPRRCGLHKCQRRCHVGPCEEGNPSGRSCRQTCGASRRDCPHSCNQLCHPGQQCPQPWCIETVTISCNCGRLSAQVPCGAGEPSEDREALAIAKLPIPLQPVENHQPLYQRSLACDEQCARLDKRKILAAAFGATMPAPDWEKISPEGSRLVMAASGEGSEVLLETLRRSPEWVVAVEARLYSLLLARSGGGVSRAHTFRAMPKERREALHELAGRFGLSSLSAGREPKRFVVVHNLGSKGTRPRPLAFRPPAGPTTPPLFSAELDMDFGCVVEFRDLRRDTNLASDLVRFAGECELLWLDDHNALVIFSDPVRASTALRYLDLASSYRGAVIPPPAKAVGGTKPAWGAPGAKPGKKKSAREGWVEDAWEEGPGSSRGSAAPVAGAWQARGEGGLQLKQSNPFEALGGWESVGKGKTGGSGTSVKGRSTSTRSAWDEELATMKKVNQADIAAEPAQDAPGRIPSVADDVVDDWEDADF